MMVWVAQMHGMSLYTPDLASISGTFTDEELFGAETGDTEAIKLMRAQRINDMTREMIGQLLIDASERGIWLASISVHWRTEVRGDGGSGEGLLYPGDNVFPGGEGAMATTPEPSEV